MKKVLIGSLLGVIFLVNSGFAYSYYQNTDSDWGNQDPYRSSLSIPENTSHYHVYQQAPKRNGFENEELPFTSKSQTFGDTTYHIYDSKQPRRGFSN